MALSRKQKTKAKRLLISIGFIASGAGRTRPAGQGVADCFQNNATPAPTRRCEQNFSGANAGVSLRPGYSGGSAYPSPNQHPAAPSSTWGGDEIADLTYQRTRRPDAT